MVVICQIAFVLLQLKKLIRYSLKMIILLFFVTSLLRLPSIHYFSTGRHGLLINITLHGCIIMYVCTFLCTIQCTHSIHIPLYKASCTNKMLRENKHASASIHIALFHCIHTQYHPGPYSGCRVREDDCCVELAQFKSLFSQSAFKLEATKVFATLLV